MGNPFVHVELGTTDPDKAKNFYKSLFNWKLEDMPMEGGMNYTMVSAGEGTGGGIMKRPETCSTTAWLPYVAVDDVGASTDKARSLGAEILKEKTEVKDYGWFSVIKDPTGGVLGLWQEKAGAMKKEGATKEKCCCC